jgi:hypothetical protein
VSAFCSVPQRDVSSGIFPAVLFCQARMLSICGGVG